VAGHDSAAQHPAAHHHRHSASLDRTLVVLDGFHRSNAIHGVAWPAEGLEVSIQMPADRGPNHFDMLKGLPHGKAVPGDDLGSELDSRSRGAPNPTFD